MDSSSANVCMILIIAHVQNGVPNSETFLNITFWGVIPPKKIENLTTRPRYLTYRAAVLWIKYFAHVEFF